MIRHLIILCCVAAGFVNYVGAENLNSDTSHQVMAFYYPWYGTPQGRGGQGKSMHWGKVDAEEKDIEASRNYPALGAYDSHEPKVVEQHCAWANQAGIDTFIVSWWGHGSYEDKAMPLILKTCAKHNMTACVYYEAVPEPKSPQSAADDIVKILKHYAGHSAYLKTAGKPVVFVYGRAVSDIGLYGWYQARQLINQKYKGGVVLIGDQMSYAAANAFDATHTYNTCGELVNKPVEKIESWTRGQFIGDVIMSHDLGKISTMTIIPGYDDTKIRTPGLNTKRLDSQLYQKQWEAVLSLGPDWVIITSFNEWHEGSEIEPSVQHGDSYLKLTEQYAKQFKAMGPGIVLSSRLKCYGPPNTELQNKFKDKTIAVLPEPESAAFWFLLKTGVNVKVLTWREVSEGLDPKKYAMVLYAGQERYCSTAQKTEDVDDAINQYVKGGGTLLVLSSGPLPFYYDWDNKVINRAAKFGLNIQGAWERPPQGDLVFIDPQKQQENTKWNREMPFGDMGEQRWRPYVADEGVKSMTLLTLEDKSNGKSYGDGLVIVYPASGGRVAYGWSGLLASPYVEIVCNRLLEKLAE